MTQTVSRVVSVNAGRPVQVSPASRFAASHRFARPGRPVSVALVSDAIMLDEGLLARAAEAPELPHELARWMRERAAA